MKGVLIILLFVITFTAIKVVKYTSHDNLVNKKNTQTNVSKIKRSKASVLYYGNSVASFKLILSGDVEKNPGPGLPKPKCKNCKTTVRSNQKQLLCIHCLEVTHLKCSNNTSLLKSITKVSDWTCPECMFNELPFLHVNNLDQDQSIEDIPEFYDDFNPYLDILNNHRNRTSIAHLNTQSIISTFSQFELMLNTYMFDVMTISETWLQSNEHIINYVQIPDYNLEINWTTWWRCCLLC